MKTFILFIYKCLVSCLPESRGFGIKCALLRFAGAKIGKNVRIYSSAQFIGTGSLTIGNDVHIGSGVFVSVAAPYEVVIGSHVDIGPHVMMLTGSHKMNPSDDPKDSSVLLSTHMAGEGCGASVIVSDGCWLGARSMLLPGVALPRKTMVAAGSVVTQSVDPQIKCLWAGCPAVVKKRYSE